MTVGVFGYAEYVISEPLSPKELVKIIYEKCMPFDPIECVLQQEVYRFMNMKKSIFTVFIVRLVHCESSFYDLDHHLP